MSIENRPYINSVKYLFEIYENENFELEFRVDLTSVMLINSICLIINLLWRYHGL